MVAGASGTLLLLAVCLVQVLRTPSDPSNGSASLYVPAALAACGVFIASFGVAAFIDRLDIGVSGWLQWLIGIVSLLFAAVPWFILTFGSPDVATWMYQGLRIPQGIERFWDLSLVLQSVDCDRWGFDVFAANNGCLKDPAIYGPGMLWLNVVPFVFSAKNVLWLGAVAMVLSSLALVWLARQSGALGQFTLLAAAVGAPWLLLLERGNVDAFVVWCAILVVFLVRRWDSVWAWSIAAVAVWLVGTWKYYPFAMGLMLLPVLRLRRGWVVLVAWLIATLGYVALTWENFRFSAQSNSNMTEIGDFVVLGRVAVVARMVFTQVGDPGYQLGDLLVLLLAVAAALWGAGWAARRRAVPTHPAMLAIAGSSVFLVSVLVAGFGWAYKAAFLLLCVPLLSSIGRGRGRAVVFPAVAMLALTGVASIVVWNTLLATLAGVVAASFAFGAASVVVGRSIRRVPDSTAPKVTSAVP